jgi:hypothetical protein
VKRVQERLGVDELGILCGSLRACPGGGHLLVITNLNSLQRHRAAN